MKKYFFLFLFLFPFTVFAKGKGTYELTLSKEFLDYAEKFEKLDVANDDEKTVYYALSNLSIQDYFLYKYCLEKVGEPSKITEGMVFSDFNHHYMIQDNISIPYLEDYDSFKVHLVAKKTDSFGSLDFSSLPNLLEGSIFHYYLFYHSLLTDSSTLEFVRDDSYGKILSKHSKKELVLIKKKKNQSDLYFEIPKTVTLSDNTSFVEVNDANPTGLEYISIVFSREDENSNIIMDSPLLHSGIILIGICVLVVLLFLSVYLKRKK